MAGRVLTLFLVMSLLAGCSGAVGDEAVLVQRGTSATNATTTSTSTTTTSTTTTTTTRPPTTTTTAATTTTRVGGRPVTEQAYTPFASAGGVVLRHPAARVERIGFHESNLDGAQQLQSLPTSATAVVLEARARDTTARGAADVIGVPSRT